MQRFFVSAMFFALLSFIPATGQIVVDSPLPVCPKKNQCGYVDRQGGSVIKPQFLDAWDFHEGLAAVKLPTANGDKYGYIDTTGKIIIPAQFNDGSDFVGGLARTELSSKKWGFIDRTGRLVFEINGWPDSFSEGLAKVAIDIASSTPGPDKADRSDVRYGFIDTNGKLVIGAQFDRAESFSEGLAIACVHDRCGYIDKSGKWAIEPRFISVTPFSEGLAAEQTGSGPESWGYIDKTGKQVIGEIYADAKPFSEGLAAVSYNDGMTVGQYGYINTSGKLVIPLQWSEAESFSDGLVVVLITAMNEWEHYYAYVDKTGKRISRKTYPVAYKFENGIAVVEWWSLFVYLDIPQLGALNVQKKRYINKKEKIIWSETARH